VSLIDYSCVLNAAFWERNSGWSKQNRYQNVTPRFWIYVSKFFLGFDLSLSIIHLWLGHLNSYLLPTIILKWLHYLSSKSCFKLTTKHFVGVLNRSILDITTNKAGTEAQLFLMSTLFNLLILKFYCIKTTNKVVSMGRGGQKGLNNITNFEHWILARSPIFLIFRTELSNNRLRRWRVFGYYSNSSVLKIRNIVLRAKIQCSIFAKYWRHFLIGFVFSPASVSHFIIII